MSYIVIFDVIVAVLGIYLIYIALQMKKTGEINTVMASSGEIRRCADKAGFIGRIYKPTLLFGGISLAFGVLACVNDMVFHLGRVFEIGGMLVFLAAWFWFSRELRIRKAEFFKE